MADPVVSWLIPVYNAERFLCRALDSVLGQTFQDFEVIIVMEYGCKDATEMLCDQYASQDDRIVLIKNKERLGISRSLNVGLKCTRGKYIARMDADDRSYPQRLEKQVGFMDRNDDVGILCTNRRVICDDGNVHFSDHPTDIEEISARLLFGFPLNHPSMMLRGSLFRENKWEYPIGIEAEDFALCAKLVDHTKIACLEEVLLDYHEHGDNAIYARFPEVRKASALIARKALYDRLGVDTYARYDDIYFGWRELDYPITGVKGYLVAGYRLFREIYLANKEKKRIDEEVFRREIQRQWKMTVDTVGIGFLMKDIDPVRPIDTYPIEDAIENVVTQFREIFSCNTKLIVWGTGAECKGKLESLDGKYPFDLCCFVDSDPEKEGTTFLGKKIVLPKNLCSMPFDHIAIATSKYEKEIRDTLITKMGVPREKIVPLPPKDTLSLMSEKNRNIENKD